MKAGSFIDGIAVIKISSLPYRIIQQQKPKSQNSFFLQNMLK